MTTPDIAQQLGYVITIAQGFPDKDKVIITYDTKVVINGLCY